MLLQRLITSAWPGWKLKAYLSKEYIQNCCWNICCQRILKKTIYILQRTNFGKSKMVLVSKRSSIWMYWKPWRHSRGKIEGKAELLNLNAEVHLLKVDKKSSCSINQAVVAQEADLQKSEEALTGQEHNQSFKAQETCTMQHEVRYQTQIHKDRYWSPKWSSSNQRLLPLQELD